ncbi:MAG: IS3 family transposase [Acidipropionibacterium jensenii]|nr:IS3 family transposase [Acidipropionibacterium jensenii]MDN6442526.1 IS3 family transposase [Acidipropionibacterium jensenii]
MSVMGTSKRKTYTPEYRREAARLVIDTGRTIVAVAGEIGVGEQLLGRWVQQERDRAGTGQAPLDLDERAELERLRREVAELRMDNEFLGKAGGLLRIEAEPEERFAVIEAEKANMTITRMCLLLGVDRRRFYEWRARQVAGPSARQQRAVVLTAQIRQFHAASDGTYGAPRIHADLHDAGVAVSRKTVAKLMQADGITGISPRTWHPPTTIRGADPFPVPDLVERHFDQGARDLAWFSDITYLHTGEGWAYLCVVRDGNTRRVLGRTVGDSLHTDLVEDALRQAVALRGHLPRKVVFHADRGTQYTSAQLAEAAAELGVLRSMGRTGVCWDNAAAESFWSTFKNEYYHRHVFATIDAARRGAYTWIDGWYNARRRHSAIGYISPLEYERRQLTLAA